MDARGRPRCPQPRPIPGQRLPASAEMGVASQHALSIHIDGNEVVYAKREWSSQKVLPMLMRSFRAQQSAERVGR